MAQQGILPYGYKEARSIWFSAQCHPSGETLSQRAACHGTLPSAHELRSGLPSVEEKKKNKRNKKSDSPPADSPPPADRSSSSGAKRLLTPCRDPLASRVSKPKIGPDLTPTASQLADPNGPQLSACCPPGGVPLEDRGGVCQHPRVPTPPPLPTSFSLTLPPTDMIVWLTLLRAWTRLWLLLLLAALLVALIANGFST